MHCDENSSMDVKDIKKYIKSNVENIYSPLSTTKQHAISSIITWLKLFKQNWYVIKIKLYTSYCLVILEMTYNFTFVTYIGIICHPKKLKVKVGCNKLMKYKIEKMSGRTEVKIWKVSNI